LFREGDVCAFSCAFLRRKNLSCSHIDTILSKHRNKKQLLMWWFILRMVCFTINLQLCKGIWKIDHFKIASITSLNVEWNTLSRVAKWCISIMVFVCWFCLFRALRSNRHAYSMMMKVTCYLFFSPHKFLGSWTSGVLIFNKKISKFGSW
jgi:hypothetical protein